MMTECMDGEEARLPIMPVGHVVSLGGVTMGEA